MAFNETDLIELPFEIVKNSNGFSLDIGHSVTKLVYRDVKDWDFQVNEPKKLHGDFAQVHAVIFAGERRSEVILYIQQHCVLRDFSDRDIVINTTGIRSKEYEEEYKRTLHVCLKHLPKVDCTVRAFEFMCSNVSENRLLYEVPEGAINIFQKHVEQFQFLLGKMKVTKISDSDFELTKQSKEEQIEAIGCIARSKEDQSEGDGRAYGETELTFPYLLGILGSNVSLVKVNADGESNQVEVSSRAGMLFHGLGTLLTGVKCYEELLDLASRGDSHKVHTYGRDQGLHDEGDDYYGDWPDDFLSFCFGKGVDKNIGDFKKEDLTRALLEYICRDIAHTTYLVMKDNNLDTVYMCGTFGSNHIVREYFTEEFLLRTMFRGEVGQRSARFVRSGTYLGAVGAFMQENQ